MLDNNNLMIVVVGETGSGKSWLLRDILSKYPGIKVIKKYTTRKSRLDEDNSMDIQSNTNYEVVSQLDYTYVNPNNNELYGFDKEDIEKAFNDGDIPCIGLTNKDAFNQIKNDFSDRNVLLMKIEPYSDEPDKYNDRKNIKDQQITDWVYDYQNMREVINPFFLENCPPKIAKGVVVRRVEDIIEKECGASLGISYNDNNSSISGIYEYLYKISLNKPIDKDLNFNKTSHITK